MKFTVYYRKQCGYSEAALQLLKDTNKPYIAHEVSAFGGKDKVIRELRANNFIPKESTHNTVPIVFDPKNRFIGGHTELKSYIAKK